MLDSLLQRLGEALRDENSRRAFRKSVLRWIRRFLAAATVFYAGGLLLLALLLSWVGERNLTLAFLLYLPRQAFLIPLPFLMAVTLPFHWRLLPIQLGTAILFVLLGMGWQTPLRLRQPAGAGPALTLLTYNRGQHMNQSLQPFKNLTQPDLLLFQEAPFRAAQYAKAEGYEEFAHGESEGEFTLLSRYPILGKRGIALDAEGRQVQVAARFEIDFEGRSIALYGVHFETPRDTLRYYARGAFLYGLIGMPGTPFSGKRQINQRFWDERIAQVRQLLGLVEAEQIPVLVAGDCNAPAGGYIHRLFTRKLGDAHQAAGSGCGFTFPGVTRNPLSRGGPWMRIDYIFFGRDWRAAACITEQERPSQHRAVAATLKLLEAGRRPFEAEAKQRPTPTPCPPGGFPTGSPRRPPA